MVIPGHNLGNSQVSVNRTIGPTLVLFVTINLFYQFAFRYELKHSEFVNKLPKGKHSTKGSHSLGIL